MRLSNRLLPSAAFLALTLAAWAAPACAQQAPSYERRELTIPVRDGVKLFAVALIPKEASQPLPIMLIRTPYSAANAFPSAELPAAYRELAQDGYIFVTEDIRGRFGSEGTYVMVRAQNDPRSPKGINESTDTYDTIDWLVKNLPGNSGKVGVMGISYPGWLAGVAGVDPHPALKAISPQAPMTDTWLGDDFFHQGAFRQTMGLEFTAAMERSKGFTGFDFPEYDHYSFYLRFPTLDSLAKATDVARLPSWVAFSTHPAYDTFWTARAMQNVLTKAEVPILFVGGFWDQEDILGPQLGYRTVERADTKGWNRIVLGPWFHGGWARVPGDAIGPIALGSRTSYYFRENIQRPWFAWYLHGQGDGRFPEAWAFETGENAWHTFDAWPPREARPARFVLESGGRLRLEAPDQPTRGHGDTASGTAGTGAAAALAAPPRHAGAPEAARVPASLRPLVAASADYDAYVSDPAHPIPYIARPDDGSGWRTWLEQDQRFVDNRPDVLSWKSEPLAEDLTIAGDVVAHLFASTTGTDADWVVKLIDVYPDTVAGGSRMGGFQLMVNADIMRGRYWRGFDKPTAIPANTVTRFDIDLHQQLYRFRKGHRVMVQVQSSWFPLYDRNPQTFVPNIFQARASDFRAQEHRVWHTARYPSHISVGVLR